MPDTNEIENMIVEEQDDGSALISMSEEPEVDRSFSENLAETLDEFKLNTIASTLLDLI